MIKEYIDNLKEDQKRYYLNRPDILFYALWSNDIEEIDNFNFKKIRSYVLDMDWEYEGASFDEWMLRGIEMLYVDLKKHIKLHIRARSEQGNRDYVAWMEYIYSLIK